MRAILAAAVWVAAAGVAGAQEKPPAAAPKPDLAAESRQLAAAYEAADERFWAPFNEAKTDAARQRAFEALDFAKHPYREYLGKFRDLATRAKKTDAALAPLGWILTTDAPDEPDVAALTWAIDTVLADHLDSDILGPFPLHVVAVADAIGEAKAEAAIRKLRDGSPHPATKGDAGYALARLLIEASEGEPERIAARRAEGLALLKEVVAAFPKAVWAGQAKGTLFEQERLQIGMVAPDFEATDQDGKTFKLSDYRGKVVVVDFWGYW